MKNNIKKTYIFLYFCYSFSTLSPASISYNLVYGLPNIYIDTTSESIGHTWTNGYVYEKHLINKFYSLLPQNNHFVVFDLGAQTGCFSLLAKFFPNSQWYAFEPIQEVVEVLKANLKLNNIENVSVFQTVVSNYNGNNILKMPAMNAWGLSTVGANVLRFDTFTEREVSCICLDSFVDSQNISKVHFIKIDTEGSELAILRGAKRMINRDHPIILMEYNETNLRQCGATKQEIDNFLLEMGYTWQLVSTEDILCMPIL